MKTRQMKNDSGLIVDSANPGRCAGYIFNFAGHGGFDPDGKVGEFTQAEIDRHNSLIAQAELKALIERGKGCLYLTNKTPTVINGRLQFGMYGDCEISQFAGGFKAAGRFHLGSHNMARTRYDDPR